MTKGIIIWEAPRSRGTAISYGLYNGLTQAGESVVFYDEPDNYVYLSGLFNNGGEAGVREHHISTTSLIKTICYTIFSSCTVKNMFLMVVLASQN